MKTRGIQAQKRSLIVCYDTACLDLCEECEFYALCQAALRKAFAHLASKMPI